MPVRNRILRTTFLLFLLTCLLTMLAGRIQIPVKAASSSIVISQVYGGGGNSGATYQNDFIELFNLGSTTVNLDTWSIQYASATSSSWTAITLSGLLAPGQYYLVQLGSNGAVGSALPTPNVTSTTNMSATDGKVALVDSTTALTVGCPTGGSVIDLIGYGSANCSETTNATAPSATTADVRSNVCLDTDNNGVDFSIANPNPHNTLVTPNPCLGVTNVAATTVNGVYTVGANIDITVTFSNIVNVTGVPTLQLETGTNDRKANYTLGDGSNILTFTYTVLAGDTSGDLDYVATNSLSLNGGTITGAAGNAILTLPTPGTGVVGAGSLSVNSDIKIDNGDGVPPSIISFSRQPTSLLPTNANSLVFRAAFSEAVLNADVGDFVATGTTAIPTSVVLVSSGIYDVTISGGDLTNLNGVVGLNLSGTQNITDVVLNPLPAVEPSIDETYVVDNTSPTVTINLAVGQATSTAVTPVNYAVVFSEPIDVNTFTVADITLSGTTTFANWNIIDSGDHQNFTISATAVAPNGTIIPVIAASRVRDLAGNNNSNIATGPTVNFGDFTPPTVTVNQAVGQSDPAAFFPVNFAVVFSEPIATNTFSTSVPSDITQNGTATGVTWSITDSGDHMNFTLSAIAATGSGTLQPSIAVNRVTDLVGNNNTASTSTDNTVVYDITRPTVTVNQANGQADPTNNLPINFTVVFSEPIDAATFTTADIIQAGTASGIVWSITDSGDHKTFNLSAVTMTKNGTLIPAIGINRVTDLAGNNNFASTSTDNSVTCTAIVPTPTRTPTVTPTATPTLGVFISEVAWMGTTASSSDEWVELYNSGPADVDLINWTLTSTNGSINLTFLSTDPNHIIKSHEFFILAPVGTFTEVVIDKTITASFSNSGLSLELRNSSGVLIDTANSNGGSWPAGIASPTYATMERHNGTSLDTDFNWYTFAGTPTTHDRNSNLVQGTPGYANWAIAVTATPSPLPTATRRPTPTRTPLPPPPPPLVAINEFVPRPGHDWNSDGEINTGDEYIEIINHGVIPVNLGGYLLDDEANVGSRPYSLPSTTLQPGERIVFYGSQTRLLLSDGGDGVRLLKSGGQLVDAYNYAVAKYPDQSFCRLPDNGGLDDWNDGSCLPTPGLKNKPGTGLPPDGGEFDSLCPIADALPEDFVLAECPSIGNIWSRYYWDQDGWLNEIFIPNQESQWDIFVE